MTRLWFVVLFPVVPLGRKHIIALDLRLDRHEKEMAASRKERATVIANNTFFPPTLSACELDDLRCALAAEPEIAVADLAQKALKYFAHQRLFVLCARRRSAWHHLPNADADRALAHRLARKVLLPGRVLVIPPSSGFGGLANRVRQAGIRVWP